MFGCGCDICVKFVARNMVEPFRGWPTREDKQLRDARQIFERVEYWQQHKEHLETQFKYDPSNEKIDDYPSNFQLNSEGRPDYSLSLKERNWIPEI